MAVGVLASERNDGCLPEAEARPPQHLQSAVEQISPSHLDVSFYVSIHVLLPEESQDRVQIECKLLTTENNNQ